MRLNAHCIQFYCLLTSDLHSYDLVLGIKNVRVPIFTEESSGWHETAHPADILVGHVEAVLPRAVLQEGPGRTGPANAGSHHEVAQGRSEGGKVLGAILGRGAQSADHGDCGAWRVVVLIFLTPTPPNHSPIAV